MKILAITQARIGSTRLPGKIMKEVNGETLLEIHLKRILKSKLISELKVATTNEDNANQILEICNKLNIKSHQGSLNNVLERFYYTALPENPDWIVRLTSDCPLIDSSIIDTVISHAVQNNFDYVSNTLKPTFPDGMDVEVFKFSALEYAFKNATLKSELEHVTPYIWKNSSYSGGATFSSDCVMNDVDYSNIRLTVDTFDDFLVIENLIQKLGTDRSCFEYISTLINHPEIAQFNSGIKRNEGYQKSINNE